MAQLTLSEELLKKVRRIEITTRKLVSDTMSGQFRSHFKGHGVQFSEHRQYVPGDDVRHIDWKASARSKESLVKKYEEERELTVLLVVDVSASESFGSFGKLKSEVLAEVGGMLSCAATLTGDRVGALLFTSDVEKIIPPKKGRSHVQRIIHTLLSYKPKNKGTQLALALDAAGRVLKHSGIVFVLSDFRDKGYERSLQRLARRHDVVAVRILDPKESEMSGGSLLRFVDPETGASGYVDTSSYRFKKWLKEASSKFESETDALFKKNAIETIRLTTEEDYGEAIVRFFKKRKRSR